MYTKASSCFIDGSMGNQTEIQQKVQSTLGFATLDKAANLDLATARALTDLRQYINSDLVFSDLKF